MYLLSTSMCTRHICLNQASYLTIAMAHTASFSGPNSGLQVGSNSGHITAQYHVSGGKLRRNHWSKIRSNTVSLAQRTQHRTRHACGTCRQQIPVMIRVVLKQPKADYYKMSTVGSLKITTSNGGAITQTPGCSGSKVILARVKQCSCAESLMS